MRIVGVSMGVFAVVVLSVLVVVLGGCWSVWLCFFALFLAVVCNRRERSPKLRVLLLLFVV